MKPDLRLWIDLKIDTSVPELVSRAIILEVLECCESKLAFHRSHVVLNIVVEGSIPPNWEEIVVCPTEVRHRLQIIWDGGQRLSALDKVMDSFL